MAGSLVKQPNGLLCRYSSIVDCPTHWNMTEEDYIKMSSEYQSEAEAIDTIKNYLQPFQYIIEKYTPNNMKLDEFADFLINVGYMKEPTIQKEFKSFLEENSELILYMLAINPARYNVEKEFLILKFKDKKESIII